MNELTLFVILGFNFKLKRNVHCPQSIHFFEPCFIGFFLRFSFGYDHKFTVKQSTAYLQL